MNSDDPAYFGGYINDNFVQIAQALHLSTRHAWQLAHHSLEASFADDADRQRWVHRLKETFERFVEHDG